MNKTRLFAIILFILSFVLFSGNPAFTATQTQRVLVIINYADCRGDSAPEGTSQDFHAGQLVYLDANGQLTECATDATLICGIASQNATTVQGTVLRFIRIGYNTVLESSVYSSSSSTAVTARAQVGDDFSLMTTGDSCYVDIDDNSNKVFKVVGTGSDYRPLEEALGDIYGRVKVRVNYDHIQ